MTIDRVTSLHPIYSIGLLLPVAPALHMEQFCNPELYVRDFKKIMYPDPPTKRTRLSLELNCGVDRNV